MILVTTPRGGVGREVVRELRARGVEPRLAERLDFRDPRTFDDAVRGCTGLFLLRPPAIANTRTTLNVLVERARAAGVSTIVFLSVAGADTNPIVPHHQVERALRAGPADWTILRPGFFAQNFETAYVRDIREDDRVYVPAGRGQVAFVDVRDLAAVAAAVLVAPAAHHARGYTLTGGQAITFDEAAAQLSAAIGRPVRYQAASIPGYARHLHRRGLPAAQIAVQTILHVGLRFGQAAGIDPTLGELLGRPPRTFAQYVRDSADLFARVRAYPRGRCEPSS